MRELFSRFFDGEHHPHPELAAFAFDPRAVVGTLTEPPPLGHIARCADFQPMSLSLSRTISETNVMAAINRDFPQWTPRMGLCAQCADLYRANQLSIAAAKQLPGGHSDRL